MNQNLNTTFEIITFDDNLVPYYVTGVAIWRDRMNNDLYIATTAFAVHGYSTSYIIDYKNRKYTNHSIIIKDRLYDIAIVKLPHAPVDIPVAKLSTLYNTGDDIYTIGWVFGSDVASVSAGVIRSKQYSSQRLVNFLLIDAPCLDGNLGGGVFLKKTNKLIGIYSYGWYVDNTRTHMYETFNGVIPSNVIYEALLTVQYESIQQQLSYHRNNYYIGIETSRLPSALTSILLHDARDEYLRNKGHGGVIVERVLPNSPVQTTFMSATETSFDIIWAVRDDYDTVPRWILVTEEMPLYAAIQSIVDRNLPRRRKFQTTVISSNNALLARNDIILPDTFSIKLLVSRYDNGELVQYSSTSTKFSTKNVTLVRRAAYSQRQGSQDQINTFSIQHARELEKRIFSQQKNLKTM